MSISPPACLAGCRSGSFSPELEKVNVAVCVAHLNSLGNQLPPPADLGVSSGASGMLAKGSTSALCPSPCLIEPGTHYVTQTGFCFMILLSQLLLVSSCCWKSFSVTAHTIHPWPWESLLGRAEPPGTLPSQF